MRMRAYAVAAAAVVGIAVAVTVWATSPARPVWFQPADGSFRVQFPGTPETTVSSEKLEDGRRVRQSMVRLDRPPCAYLVLFVDLPADIISNRLVESLLDDLRETLRADARIVQEERTTMAGLRAREWRMSHFYGSNSRM